MLRPSLKLRLPMRSALRTRHRETGFFDLPRASGASPSATGVETSNISLHSAHCSLIVVISILQVHLGINRIGIWPHVPPVSDQILYELFRPLRCSEGEPRQNSHAGETHQ